MSKFKILLLLVIMLPCMLLSTACFYNAKEMKLEESINVQIQDGYVQCATYTNVWEKIISLENIQQSLEQQNKFKISGIDLSIELRINDGKLEWKESQSSSWTALDVTFYSVSFDTGTSSKVATQYLINNDVVISPTKPTKDGYDFAGWYNGAIKWSFTSKVTKNLELKAKWDIVEYSITYNMNGGTNNSQNPTSYTIEDEDITLLNPTRTSYTFAGWYDNATFTGNAITTIVPNSKKDISLFAKWTKLTESSSILLEEEVIVIDSASELNQVLSNNLTKNIKLLDNFDLKGFEWTSIGDENNNFTGTFDGNGFTISNFTITTGNVYNGFFGYAKGATIKDLGLTDFTINYSFNSITYAGGLAGISSNCNIANCYVTGNVAVTTIDALNVYAGCFIGLSGDTISNSYATGNVTVTSTGCDAVYTGGFVGGNVGVIVNSYATGNVTATTDEGDVYAGGLVGENYFTITNSYATGDVSATVTSTSIEDVAYAGGLVGSNYDESSIYYGSITNCYRYSEQAIKINNNVNSSNTLGTSATMANIWKFISKNWESQFWSFSTTKNPTLLEYDGEYVEISNINELLALRGRALSANYILTKNISLNQEKWKPIMFIGGTFDGKGFEVSNFKINTANKYNGFFGYVENSIIKNLGLKNFSINYSFDKGTYAGGLVGYISSGTIIDSYVTGDVTATTDEGDVYAGGLVGHIFSGTITNCYATGNVTATTDEGDVHAGGFVGYIVLVTITNCYATGDVSITPTSNSSGSYSNIGGFVGSNYGSTTNCYATGDVSITPTSDSNGSYSYIGGFVGRNYGSTTNCYRYNEQRLSVSNNNRTISSYGTNASMFTIWEFVSETWDISIWELSTTANPTLRFQNPNSRLVKYNLNDGTNNPENPRFFTIGDEDITLLNPTRTGYTFGGWYNNETFTGNAITTIDCSSLTDISLYAKWTIIEYSITYDLKDGTNSRSNPITYTIEDDDIELLNPTKTGYTFGGWYDNERFTGNSISTIYTSSLTNKSLYAKWSISVYSITYYSNSGINNSSNPTTYTIEDENFELLDPTREGYAFGGWYTNSYFTGNVVTTIDVSSLTNINLYAKWTRIYTYSITYYLDGGLNNTNNPSSYTSIDEDIVLLEPTKTGYTFGGWYNNETFTGNAITTIDVSYGMNIYLYAKWTKVLTNYSITYNLNGGTNNTRNPNSYTIEDEDIKLLEPTKIGYSFGGWYNNSLFTGNPITTIDVSNQTNISLYAKWTIIQANPSSILVDGETIDFDYSYELNQILNNNLSSSIKLLDDYDLNGFEWTPIGTYDNPFIGTFDGDGYVISDFNITEDREYIGFFGYTKNATIKNLGLIDFSIDVSSNYTSYVGGLVGADGKGTIISCYATGSVTINATDGSFGGLIGTSTGSIINCYATGNVMSNTSGDCSNSGGLVGEFIEGVIVSCYATGNITAISNSGTEIDAGGLIAENNGTLISSYATGDVTISSSCTDSYAIAFADVRMGGNVAYCYHYNEQIIKINNVTNSPNIGIINDKNVTSATMSTIWEFVLDNWESQFWNFNTIANPTTKLYNGEFIEISTVGELLALQGRTLTANYKLMNNINLNQQEWEPITFALGTFDGCGYEISNFKITTAREINGFFGFVLNSTIKNLGVTSITIDYTDNFNPSSSQSNMGSTSVGVLAGYNRDSSITNCYTSGSIKIESNLSNSDIGGLVSVNTGEISNCYSLVNISTEFTRDPSIPISNDGSAYYSGEFYVGGLVSANTNVITNCYSMGDISVTVTKGGILYVGGLVGWNIASSSPYSDDILIGAITYCYATGDVTGIVPLNESSGFLAGGLVGFISSGIINYSYATGDVINSEEGNGLAGGLVGYNEQSSSITNCYRYSGQTIKINSAETLNKEGTSATMANIWKFVLDNWDSTIWNLSTTANPTLKQS